MMDGTGSNRFDIRMWFLVAVMVLAGLIQSPLNAGNGISGKNLEDINLNMYNPEDLGLHTLQADLSFRVTSKGRNEILSGYGSVLEQVKLRMYWKKPDLLQFRNLGVDALKKSRREKANHMLENFRTKYLYTLLRRVSIQGKITRNRIDKMKKKGGIQSLYLRYDTGSKPSRSVLSFNQRGKLTKLGFFWGQKVHWMNVSLTKVHHKTLVRKLKPVRNSADILPKIRVSYKTYRLGNDHKVRIGSRIEFDDSLEMVFENVKVNPDFRDVQFHEERE